MTKNSSSSKAHLALNVRMDGARKMPVKRAKTPLTAITAIEEVIDRDGEDLVNEMHVRNLGSFLHCHDEHLLLHANGHATTLSKNWLGSQRFSQRAATVEPSVSSTMVF